MSAAVIHSSGFGMRIVRVWTLARATVTQLIRMKILFFLLLFCVLVVGAGFAFSVINPEQQLGLIKTVSLGALQIFSLVIGIVSTALLLPKDMEDRTLYTILSKPVPRFEYLAGKLLGVLLLIGGGLIIMDLVLSAVIYTRQGMVMQEALRALEFNGQATPETIARLKGIVARQGLTWEMHWAVLAIFLKSAVVTTMALVLACIASSTLFTIVVAFCAVIIGHGEHLLREFFLHPYFSGQTERLAALALALVFPDLAQFDIVDGVVAGEPVPWSAVLDMLGIAAMYVCGYMTIAHLLFVEKEL
jgi:ABC-type Na+ efflux pump permease subunit